MRLEGAGGEALLGVSRYLLPSPFGEGLGVRLYMPCSLQYAPRLQLTLYRLQVTLKEDIIHYPTIEETLRDDPQKYPHTLALEDISHD